MCTILHSLITSIRHRAKVKTPRPPFCYFAVCKIITASEVAYFPQYQFPYVISDPQMTLVLLLPQNFACPPCRREFKIMMLGCQPLILSSYQVLWTVSKEIKILNQVAEWLSQEPIFSCLEKKVGAKWNTRPGERKKLLNETNRRKEWGNKTIYIWRGFDRASSLICGNKMPTRCNRGFIADLIACSTCFGQHYAHHQELKSIIQWLLSVVFGDVVLK